MLTENEQFRGHHTSNVALAPSGAGTCIEILG